MNEYRIRLTSEQVPAFVNAAERCNCDVDIMNSRFIVDAKSLMGVLCLDLSRTLTVRMPEKDDAFEKAIAPFALA